jgi:hypothetical protein
MVNFSIFESIGSNNDNPILESFDEWTRNKRELQVQQPSKSKSNHELTAAAQTERKTQTTEYFSIFDSIGLT